MVIVLIARSRITNWFSKAIILVIDAFYLVAFLSSLMEGHFNIALISGFVCVLCSLGVRKIDAYPITILILNLMIAIVGLFFIAHFGEKGV